MDIWCCCQQCWPETPVVTWGHIARQQGTQYSTVHSTLATVHQWTHGPLRYQSSPCKKWHCLDLFKVQDVLPSRYIAHMSQPPAPVSSHCWLLLNLTCHQWPRRDSLFLIIIWSPIICDYSTAQSWLVSCVQRHFPRGETWLGLVEEPQNIRPQWGQLLVGANTAFI